MYVDKIGYLSKHWLVKSIFTSRKIKIHNIGHKCWANETNFRGRYGPSHSLLSSNTKKQKDQKAIKQEDNKTIQNGDLYSLCFCSSTCQGVACQILRALLITQKVGKHKLLAGRMLNSRFTSNVMGAIINNYD